jgi:hypothetical protein
MIPLLLALEPITPRDAAWAAAGTFVALIIVLCTSWRMRP